MIQISQMKLPITHSREELTGKIARLLKLPSGTFSYEIIRQSLDARHKQDKKFVYTVWVKTANEGKVLKKSKDKNITFVQPSKYCFPSNGTFPLSKRPVIVGSGPAGLLCAWYLAKAGFNPILLERGDEARIRKEKVDGFWQGKELDLNSNVQFGEGGAGTFSDGKLNTLVKDPLGRNKEVLKRFVKAGAPEEILYQSKPHLGTDVLIGLVENLRSQMQAMGAQVRFRSQVTDLIIENGELKAVEINHGEEILETQVLVLAIGHSARDTFAMLQKRNLTLQPKAFALGVRVEHPQKMINQAMYGEEENNILGAASYKVTHQCKNGRGVYSFCMCPGGYVVNASSEPGRLAVNGMSYQARDSKNANSALIVTVSAEDFPDKGPLGGVEFQRILEEKAYQAGEGRIPIQLFEDFCKNQKSTMLGEVFPQEKGQWILSNVREFLPLPVGDAIEEGMYAFGKKIRGFDRKDALICGLESRTSSPVRIVRDKELESNIRGIYPCGEGAGYAGGITSAAMDGLKVAEAIARKYRNF